MVLAAFKRDLAILYGGRLPGVRPAAKQPGSYIHCWTTLG
jgi:hypothetical protein